MNKLSLDGMDKADSQVLIENLQNLSSQEFDRFIQSYAVGDEPAWHRFIKGAYNHPITWWIGLFQLQMQLGLWGPGRRAQASIFAGRLWKASEVLRGNPKGRKIIETVVKYNLRYRKSDLSGRVGGGIFTSFAATGGLAGARRLSRNAKRSAAATHFLIASYGAAIKSVAIGKVHVESIVQSVLTGRPELPVPKINYNLDVHLSEKEQAFSDNAESALFEIMSFSQLAPAPVAISEFCSRPENVDIKGLCK
ncbi:hypothetical protein OOT55_06875 [Marinimicrobium sp. C6131]|uniref:hypothetical protein n=1 Tax=Marinimicrobium sp. C6131 TaxID=3022676 RepID=UPI00223E4826|nr:hypothetical protein [Marinimicrobium sp. C6131]UZJ45767.1 hypothetical protein OOT55_06875 [Marinimicrobium sp. C6131]